MKKLTTFRIEFNRFKSGKSLLLMQQQTFPTEQEALLEIKNKKLVFNEETDEITGILIDN